MTSYRLFPATNGPATAVSYGGEFAAGVGFQVTSGNTWFEGYWWWVCASGAPTSPQTFALWQTYSGGDAVLVDRKHGAHVINRCPIRAHRLLQRTCLRANLF